MAECRFENHGVCSEDKGSCFGRGCICRFNHVDGFQRNLRNSGCCFFYDNLEALERSLAWKVERSSVLRSDVLPVSSADKFVPVKDFVQIPLLEVENKVRRTFFTNYYEKLIFMAVDFNDFIRLITTFLEGFELWRLKCLDCGGQMTVVSRLPTVFKCNSCSGSHCKSVLSIFENLYLHECYVSRRGV